MHLRSLLNIAVATWSSLSALVQTAIPVNCDLSLNSSTGKFTLTPQFTLRSGCSPGAPDHSDVASGASLLAPLLYVRAQVVQALLL
jgi:hypothetical protein